MNAELISVLLVDDDPGDVLLVREAFDDHKVGNLLSVVNDGVQAMEYVRGENDYAGVARPDLILLDLNLPRKSGIEVLEEIKSDPQLSTILVVVLAYKLHANAYITKPFDFERFTQIVHQIDEFFIGLVKLPSSGARAGVGRGGPAGF
jgi:CheY-like chemotaxis protein